MYSPPGIDELDEVELFFLRSVYLLYTQGVMPSDCILFLIANDSARVGSMRIPPYLRPFPIIELVSTLVVDVKTTQEIFPNITPVGAPRENAFDAQWMAEIGTVIMTPKRLKKELKSHYRKASLNNYVLRD